MRQITSTLSDVTMLPLRMTMQYEIVCSPLNYIGGKHKLLPQILPLFPNNINVFIDLPVVAQLV